MEIKEIEQLALKVKSNIQQVIVGKDDVIDLLLVALISSGHVLLEDVPGTGKTLLAKTMAKSLQCSFKRIQFTPDLLPSDLSGIHYFNQKSGEFEFRAGPLFTQILLADEINRATPRTQSSLLECMEERQISIDGTTHVLSRPFMVIATQNPVENQGTFPLPEAQLDRFLVKVSMGYPTTDEGLQILKRFKSSNPIEHVAAVADSEHLIEVQQSFTSVHVSDDLLNYMVQIVEKTRAHSEVALGASPRGSQALLRAVQAYAAIQGRDYASPDDVKRMAEPVLAHRILLKSGIRTREQLAKQVLEGIVREVPVPAEEALAKR